MPKMLTTSVWLTLTPQFGRQTYNRDQVQGFSVSKMTKSRPKDRSPVVKLVLKMPDAAFAPLAPTVTIEVPEDALSWPEPEITVESES